MQFRYNFLLLSALSIFSTIDLSAQVTGAISGRVIDDSTGVPLQAANVFLANTMIGTATNANGFFTLHNPPGGSHQIVVSMIGYKVASARVEVYGMDDQQLEFRLKPTVLQAPEITVKALSDRTRKAWFKLFASILLGQSKNATQCKIINPEVVRLNKPDDKTLVAFSDEPIIVENRALGYKVQYILEDFHASDSIIAYNGKIWFQELAPKNDGQSKRWAKKRERAYHGSLRHFLATLSRPQSQKSAFSIFRLPESQKSKEPVTIPPESLWVATGRPFEKKLVFEDKVYVFFDGEKAEQNYVDLILSQGPGGVNRNRISDASLRLRKHWAPKTYDQMSMLTLLEPGTVIDSDGHVYSPKDILLGGYMGFERLAEKLPWEYYPDSQNGLDFQTTATAIKQNPGSFEQGLELKKQGEWEKALQVWWREHVAMDVSGQGDPRIGIAFIELATERKASKFYGTACEIYLKNVQNAKVGKFAKILRNEAARVIPLLDEESAKKWQNLAKNDLRKLTREMVIFWNAQDPNPMTSGNERLIEHWERIAHARKEFTLAVREPYGTDDRGKVYVKYGQPDRLKTGSLGSNITELYRIAENRELRENILFYDAKPDYEVWIYYGLNPEQSVVYLFGHRGGTGTFGLVGGVEDLIFESAFSRSTERIVGPIRPGYYLQMSYYNELAALDDYFMDRYDWLNTEWGKIGSGTFRVNPQTLKSYFQSIDARNHFEPTDKYAESARSDFAEKFNTIQIKPFTYRFLDDKQQPLQIVYIVSQYKISSAAFGKDENKNIYLPDLTIRHSLINYDQNLRQLSQTAPVIEQPERNAALFVLPDTPQIDSFLITAQAKDEYEGGKADSVFGIGKSEFIKKSALPHGKNRLVLSDMAIGVLTDEEIPATFPLPFLPSDTFWREEPVQTYLEVYNLAPNDDGDFRFQLDFRVSRLNKNGEVNEKKGQITQSFTFDAEKSTSKETFGVDISKLRTGDYEFFINVTDLTSQENATRKTTFSVTK